MIVAGIDGSTTSTGLAIMRDGELIFRTLIDLKKDKDAMRRIRRMLLKICEILDVSLYELTIYKRNSN